MIKVDIKNRIKRKKRKKRLKTLVFLNLKKTSFIPGSSFKTIQYYQDMLAHTSRRVNCLKFLIELGNCVSLFQLIYRIVGKY